MGLFPTGTSPTNTNGWLDTVANVLDDDLSNLQRRASSASTTCRRLPTQSSPRRFSRRRRGSRTWPPTATRSSAGMPSSTERWRTFMNKVVDVTSRNADEHGWCSTTRRSMSSDWNAVADLQRRPDHPVAFPSGRTDQSEGFAPSPCGPAALFDAMRILIRSSEAGGVGRCSPRRPCRSARCRRGSEFSG